MYTPKLPSSLTPLPKSHTGPIYTVKFNNAGEYILTGSEDRGVCLYNPHKSIMIKNYKNLHNYDVSAVEVTKDNAKLVTGGGDKNVIVTDIAEGKTISKFSGHNGRINSVALNADNNVIASASYDATIRCWDNRANSYTPIDIIKGFKDSVSHIEIRSFQLICGSMDGTARFYDIRMGQFVSDELPEAIQSMCVAASGRAYVVSMLEGLMCLVDRGTGTKVAEYRGHTVGNYTVKCKFDGQDSYVFTGSTDGKLYVYDIMKADPVRVINVCSGSVLSGLDVHPQGGLAATSHDGNVYFCKL